MQTTYDHLAPGLDVLADLSNVIERACAACCERRSGIIFSSLPWKTRQACIKDPSISALVSRADMLGQKPSDAVLAPEMVRVFRSLNQRYRKTTGRRRLSVGVPLNAVASGFFPTGMAVAA